KACVLPENPASYRVVRTKSYLFNKAPLPMRDDAAKSDREQPEIDRGHNDFECRVHIFSSCD
ncbi:hypothetical protein ABN302_23250, partial [Escherichia coli]|uniref:hypothetical protein n=1 Tax=Escherichia coli TaxID=562 RepID=UPI0032DA77A6